MAALVGFMFHVQRKIPPTRILNLQSNTSSLSVRQVRLLCNQACFSEALHILHKRVESIATYVDLLQGCSRKKALSEGRGIHAHISKLGFTGDRVLGNTLMNMYIKCGSVLDARRVFDEIPERDVCSWTVMIAAYARHGPHQEALSLLRQMQRAGFEPNYFTFSSVLPACANMGFVESGMEIHQEIIRSGFESHVSVASALVDMYAKCGNMENARQVFDKMPERNVVSWTAMIGAYAKHGHVEEALRLFREMKQTGIQPNQFTFASVLSACASSAYLEQGIEIHEEIIRRGFQSNVFVMTALVGMYAQCGSVDKARELFDKMHSRDLVSWNAMVAGYVQNGFVDRALNLFKKMPERNVVSWNAMIAGFGQNGLVDEALKLFKEMPERSVASWNAMIAGCSQNGLVTEALKLFQNMPQRNVLSWTAMISGFAQSGLVDEALKVFKEMPQRNVVSWNAITAGFAQNGHSEEALNVFQQMQLAGVEPNSKTFASILPAYANLGALEQGTEIHEKIIRSGLQNDVIVVNALIDMYAKCGSLCKARELFDNMHQQDVVSWTAMIGGYAMHGCSKEALKLFEQMTCSGMSPNHVTLVCVLSACSHTGLVNEGYQYFNCMNEYHIKPTIDHYSCMVDLLGRAGLLDEAHNFIIKMPIKPDAAVWSSLLGACRIHNNIELGEWVAERLLELDSEDAAPYLLLSNIYAAEGRWDDIGKIRKMMKDRDIKKTPGCSWIEVNKQVHTFLAGDRSRPQMEKIYMDMERMCHDSKVAGYLRSTTLLLNNADKKGEEQNVFHHYKNLETAHGLLNSHLWKNYSCHQKLLSV